MQAHNILTCVQPDPKENFSPIKKYEILTVPDEEGVCALIAAWKVLATVKRKKENVKFEYGNPVCCLHHFLHLYNI